MNKIKFSFYGFVAIIALISGLSVLFKKEYKKEIITDIDNLALNDTIVKVYYYKDDYGPSIATQLQHSGTPYCFNGFTRDSARMRYADIAKSDDILVKTPYSDTFLVKHKGHIFRFDLFRCMNYPPPALIRYPMLIKW